MNPQEIVMNFIQSNSNPFWKNALNLAQNGNTEELEKIASNLCSQRNWNFKDKFNSFVSGSNSFNK